MIEQLNEAIATHKSGKIEEALKAYLKLKAQQPSHGDLLHLIGICYAQLDDFQKAITHFNQALSIHQDSCEILSNLGNAHQKIGETEKAISFFHQSLQLKPSNPITHNNLGHLYLKQENIELAKSHFNQAVLQQDNYPEAHYNLGLIETKNNRLDMAIRHFQRALEHNPKHASALKMLAQVYHHNDKLDLAVPKYLEYLEIHKDTDIMHSLASCYLAIGNEENALKYYRDVLLNDPKHPELHHNLASFFLTQHNYIEAIKHWLSHLDLNPKDADTLYNLGVCYLYTGKYDESDSYLHEALQQRPKDYNTLVNLGALYLQQQKIPQSVQYYKEALKSKPNDHSIKFIIEAISGGQKGQMPQEYITNLFDQYAHYYDNHMLKVLDYKLPGRIELILNEHIHKDSKPRILDLGCGTGLIGPLLSEYAHELEGVDLSPNMIEVAGKLNVYHTLHQSDAFLYLENNHQYDWIVALELMPYINDAKKLLQSCHQSLNDNGHLIISSETHFDPSSYIQLSTSARYQYHPEKLEKDMLSSGFKIIISEKINLRKQHSQLVKGHLWVLKKI